MALANPEYSESESFEPRVLRGPPVTRSSDCLIRDPSHSPPLPNVSPQSITPESIIVNTGGGTLDVLNCIERLSDPTVSYKATYKATINESTVIVKCWDRDHTEGEVYIHFWDADPTRPRLFARWYRRGEIICSSLFQSGFALILEYRRGSKLHDIWHELSSSERLNVQSQCLVGINAIRRVLFRLDDASMDNIFYDRETGVVTLLDFEVAADIESHTVMPVTYEMRAIFGPSLLMGRPSGGIYSHCTIKY
ncbi:hypothetical protein N7466_008191 [Penicillium verhagenii]|uniref:uncharacterized protein n=1 Tax=Penicillium verhagenii TaxID=1562060 RepID=UPI00254582F7|nr:uncharacterized protein N7466_008191 [Penicillium verhagenii]KAJ5924004.1 hypothetical protein N7466_008191 [Penicillium verhagenii]